MAKYDEMDADQLTMSLALQGAWTNVRGVERLRVLLALPCMAYWWPSCQRAADQHPSSTLKQPPLPTQCG